MSKYDLGAIIAAAMGGIGPVLVWFREGLSRMFGKVWASFVAVVASPGVWAAVAITSLGGFWLGHIEGSAGKRALRAEVSRLATVGERQAATVASAEARAAAAMATSHSWQAKAEAAEAEVSRLTGRPVAASQPVAAVPKRQVAKARSSKTTASEPAKAVWWPFSN